MRSQGRLGKPFVVDGVDRLLKAAGQIAEPIDLYKVAENGAVSAIEFRPLVPEGGMNPLPTGFEILIRHTSFHRVVFSEKTPVLPLSRRQRFTLAHEIVHTLFFNPEARPPRIRKGSPKADLLEHYCHFGARRLLIPQLQLAARLGQRRPLAPALVMDLAGVFRVSPEVVMHRLQDAGAGKLLDSVLVLAEANDSFDDATILGVCSERSLLACFARPDPHGSLKRWCGSILDYKFWAPGNYEGRASRPSRDILIRKTPYSGSLRMFFLELELA